MMYYEWNDGTELQHGWLKRGAKAEKHKYIARIGESPNYRYFYTNAEYNAYLRKEELKKKIQGKASDFNNKLNSIKSLSSNIKSSNGINKFTNKANNVAKAVSNKKEAAASSLSSAKSFIKSNAKELNKKIESTKNIAKQKVIDISSGIKKANDLVKASSKKQVNTMLEDYYAERGKVLKDYKSNVTKGVTIGSFLGITGILGSISYATILAKKTNQRLSELFDDVKSKYSEMEKQMSSESPKTMDEVKKKTRSMSADEDMMRVNPYYDEGDIFKINCSYCTLAYEMRRRGYDVEADDYWGGTQPDEENNVFEELYSWYTHDGRQIDKDSAEKTREWYFSKEYVKNLAKYKGDEELARIMAEKYAYENAYPGCKWYDTRLILDGKPAYNQILDDIKSQGEGARGQFLLYWKNGGGHSVAYEVQNGKVILRDCQNGKVIDPKEYYEYASEVMYFRTDNEDINENALKGIKNKQSDTTNKPAKSDQEQYETFERSGYRVDVNRPRYDESGNYAYTMTDPTGMEFIWIPSNGVVVPVRWNGWAYVDEDGHEYYR